MPMTRGKIMLPVRAVTEGIKGERRNLSVRADRGWVRVRLGLGLALYSATTKQYARTKGLPLPAAFVRARAI
eukprot:1394642-Amorphochlora_amoeboformis.AAC.1